ncbi:hemagglutinin repeat-containing protein [Pseudoduganella sp. R-43]|uniref:hemagglutinin repeat-containing protein n=1 Tax=Pseudoduganella sp. R-43 TaxID=3404063 RepID=UPI003CE8399D
MNKLRYRIVFNKARGMLMAVGECARSCVKGASQSGALDSSVPAAFGHPALRRLTLLFGAAFGGFLWASHVQAQIIADPKAPSQNQAIVLKAANGVPQVNVREPSAAGVSRNVYSQFDVAKGGAILNNSRVNVQTELGGWVEGNPWLKAGTARVILNEVNSSNPSALRGYIEVAGQKAEVVIANPSGISVDGGGFINVSRATLTTGSPLMMDGRLTGYDVQRGQIAIDGAGLDASKTDYTALISRSLVLNASLWAQRLNVVTGVNKVAEGESPTVTEVGKAADAAPQFAIDASRLGGMYANQIFLVGTEAGVGVRNAGEIGAAAGQLVVTSEGRLENTGTLAASKGMQVTMRDAIENKGKIQAGEDLALKSASVTNGGSINAGGQLIAAVTGDFDNRGGSIEARRVELGSANGTLLNADGKIVQGGSSALNVTTGSANNSDGVLGQAASSATGGSTSGGSADSGTGAGTGGGTGGTTDAGSTGGTGTGSGTGGTAVPELQAGELKFAAMDNQHGLVTATGGINLDAATLTNQRGQVNLRTLKVDGGVLDNSQGQVGVQQDATLRLSALNNQGGRLLAGGGFNASLGEFDNSNGLLQANRLSIDVARYLNNDSGNMLHLGASDAAINVGGKLRQAGGKLETSGNLALRAGEISGTGSKLNVGGNLILSSSSTTTDQGDWRIGGSAQLETGALTNTSGAIAAAGDLSLKSSALANQHGQISTGGQASLQVAGGVDNTAGQLQASKGLTLEASGTVLNQDGSIETLGSQSSLAVKAAAIDNSTGRIVNAGTGPLALNAATIRNSGIIGGNGAMNVDAATLTNTRQGRMTATGDVNMNVASLLKNEGSISNGGSFTMSQSQSALVNSGEILAKGPLKIENGSIDNRAGTIATAEGSTSRIDITSGSLLNDAGTIRADGNASARIAGDVNNVGGYLGSGGALDLRAGGGINNDSGRIESRDELTASGDYLANRAGSIVSTGTGQSSLTASRYIVNNGLIGSNGSLALGTESLTNGAASTITAMSDLDLKVRSELVNLDGQISTQGKLNFDQLSALLRNSGSITSKGAATLNARELDNRDGQIITARGSGIASNVGKLDNRSGIISSGADTAINSAGAIDNGAGEIQAAHDLQLGAGGAITNTGGLVQASGAGSTVHLNAASIDNTAGRIVNVGTGTTSLAANGHIENSGQIAGNGNLELSADSLRNQAQGAVSAAGNMAIAVHASLDNAGTISSAGTLQANQAGLNLRNSGTIVAGGAVDLTTATLNNDGGKLATAQGSNASVNLNAQGISNQGGTIMSDNKADLHVAGDIVNNNGLLQARSDMGMEAGGTVKNDGGNIETVSSTSSLHLKAGDLANGTGRIVNVGTGSTTVDAVHGITSNGTIAGNGVVDLSAATLENKANGTIASAQGMTTTVTGSLANAGTINSGGTLQVNANGATVTNSKLVVSQGQLTLHAGDLVNDGGQLATAKNSGAAITIDAASISNRSGVIMSDAAATIDSNGKLDNTQGTLQSGSSLDIDAAGAISNNGGVVEALANNATLGLHAGSLANGTGRIVNVGSNATTVNVDATLDNAGLIAGNGNLAMTAADLANRTDGSIAASGGKLDLTVGHGMDNAGAISSRTTFTLNAAGKAVRNSGQLVSGTDASLATGAFTNDGGQLVTVKDGGGDLHLDADSVSNTGGAIVADGSANITSRGTLGNQGGVIETSASSGTLDINSGAIDNGTGRIVNVGTGATTLTAGGAVTSSGQIAGNGALNIAAATLDNATTGSISSGANLNFGVRQSLSNAGKISSSGTLTFDQAAAQFSNSGQIAAAGAINIHAANINNNGGQIATATAGGANITLDSVGAMSNRSGAIAAAGNTSVISGAGFDNTQGQVQAAANLTVNASGALTNNSGALEALGAGSKLDVQASSINNLAGRIVNAGNARTSITSASSIINSGTMAGNGALVLNAQTLQNQAGGVVSAATTLDLLVRQQLDNQGGTISSGGALTFNQAGATFANSGRMGSGGEMSIIASSIANDGGQLYTVSGTGRGVTLQANSLSNLGGAVSADGMLLATINGTVANNGGTLHAGGDLALNAASALNNGSGTIEAAGTASKLTVNAQSVASGGRIVNSGSGNTTISSAGGIANSGTIAGNGALDLHANTLLNQAGGQFGSGTAMLLDVNQQLDNQGTIGSGSTLTFDEAAATFSNSGQVAAKGRALVKASGFTNSGQVSTVAGHGAELAITTNSFTNSGQLVADGTATLSIAGVANNAGGIVQAGTDLQLTSGSALQNNGGVIEAVGAGSTLTINSDSIDNGTGRIANKGRGDTRLLSRGAITSNGTIAGMGNLLLSGTTLWNGVSGTIASGQGMDLAITQQLNNQGKVNSGGTLTFNQAGAGFVNSGQVLSGGNAFISALYVNNDGGTLGTAGGSGADLTLNTPQLSNSGGRIATDRDLFVSAGTVGALGEIFGGRDLAISMNGDYVQNAGTQQVHSNRDLSLTVTGNIINNGTLGAAGTLALSGNQVTNQAGAVIEGGAVAIRAAGDLANSGEINGESAVDLVAANISNTSGIVGGNVTVRTGSLNNTGANALIGSTGNMALGVDGTLNNVQGGTLYSAANMAVGATNGGGTALVNNSSSTIEANGDLALNTVSLRNVRDNVSIVQVKTMDETVNMTMPSWYNPGGNHNQYDPRSSNYLPFEVYFVNPNDVLKSEKYVTPDGYEITRAEIRTHANDSAFFNATSGLAGKWASRSRIPMSDGTKVIYYWDGRTITNPDQGGVSTDAYVRPPDGNLDWGNTKEYDFSTAYGSCSTNCIRMVTIPGYDDPQHTIKRDTQKHTGTQTYDQLEEKRVAHHTVVEDQISADTGKAGQILSGGNMHLTVTATLDNSFSEIRAVGTLKVDGLPAIVSSGAKLLRKHTFDGTFTTYTGSSTVAWTNTVIPTEIGSGAGTIQGGQGVFINARSFRNVDVSAGTVGNIRDSVNVIGSGANGANGAGTDASASGGFGGGVGGHFSGSALGAHANVAGNAGASGTGGNLSGAGLAGNSGVSNQLLAGGSVFGSGDGSGLNVEGSTHSVAPARQGSFFGRMSNQAQHSKLGDTNTSAGTAIGQSAGAVQGENITSVKKISPGGLFLRNPNPSGQYLFETRPQFAKEDQWTSSDYLLDKLALDHATTQKRLGDGFYEQRLVREQLSELTGRAPSAGPADDSLYKQMLNNAASFAQQFGLRPGISLSPEQVSHLTSDIVWLESQAVQLPDGSIETVLVPKVYLAHVDANAIKHSGALVTGASVTINVSETIMNQGGVIDGGNGRTLLLAGEDIINRGGTIKGGDVALQAGRDIKNETLTVDSKWSSKVNGGSYTSLSNQAVISATGGLIMDAGRNLTDLAGTINAGASASIFAGNNISFDTVKTGSTEYGKIDGTTINNSATYNQLSRVNVGGDLLMAATGNLNLTGTQVSMDAGKLLAGGSVNIRAVTDEVKTNEQGQRGKNWSRDIHENQAVVGAKISSSSDLLVSAGISQSSDLNVMGSTVAAGGTLTLKASNDLNIASVSETHLSDIAMHSESRSLTKKRSSTATDYNASTLVVGSTIKGGNVVVTSGGDTLIKASAVLADKDLSIDAKGGLSIVSAEEASKSASTREEKKSGFSVSFKSGNLSTGYGKSNTSSQSAQESVTQHASSIGSLDGSVKLKSGETLQVVASDIAAKENLTLIGKNVDLAAAQNTMQSQANTQGKSSGFGVGFTVNPLAAFKDAYKTSTENSKSGSFVGKEFAKAEGAAEGAAAALAVVNTQFGTKKTNSTQNHATSEARTSSLLAGKDLTILATDGSITSQGAQISAEGNALILAKDSIKFDVAHNTESRSQDTKKSGFSIDTRSTQVIGSLNNNGKGNGATDTVTGTKLSVGGSTTMATQTGDIALTGANVVSDGNLSINAARDLTITSAQDTLHNANQSDNKAIGKVAISDTERFSGYHNEKHKGNSDQVTQVASNVSSLNGDVNLSAGKKYTQASSNVLAGNDVNITAKSIDITALQNTGSHQESNSDLKIGTFARISSPLIDLANNVEAARKSDGRLKEMQRMAATANAYQAASAINSMTGGAGSGILVKGEAGIGFTSSSNSSNGNDSTAQGSTINGGRNVNLTATGGDIHATGATLNAGKTLSLDAAQNIVLDASQSTLHSDGKNKSSGVEAGVGFQVGAQTGVYVYAAANMGKGHNKNDSTINNNTELKADTINIHSKGDTTLKGATATANTINTDVGGKLAVESLQDNSAFDSKQSNVGVRVQVGFGVWSANGNVSQQSGKGTYAGVGQQSGLFAGDGGYHIKADTIDLKGGAIASTNAAASEMTTNKLTTSNIENKMTYSASNVSMAGGVSGGSEFGAKNEDGSTKSWSEQKQLFGSSKGGNTTPGLPMMEKGSDSSTTYATVTDGKITIGGVTTSSVKELGINTDASKANTALDKLPDLQKLLKDQQAMSAAAGTVIATSKQAASEFVDEARKAEAEAQKILAKADSTAEQRAEAEKTIDAAKQVQAEWGVGGDKSRALNVVTGILVGSVAGQGSTQIAANAAAPYLAAEIGDYFKKEGNENQTLQDLSHAVLGAALAVANNSSAVGGALAGGGGELAAQILTKELYPQAFDANGALQRDKLTPEQVNNVTALSSAIGALMSGAAGGNVRDAAIGGQVATNAVENNFLKRPEMAAMNKELEECTKQKGGCPDADYRDIRNKYIAKSNANIAKIESCTLAGDVQCVRDLESQAASTREISNELDYNEYKIFFGRQDNVNRLGTVYGDASLFGSDVQKAEEIANFRQQNCAGVSSSTCDSLVRDALWLRKERMLLTSLIVGKGAPLIARGIQKGIALPKGVAVSQTNKQKLVSGETKQVSKGEIAANDPLYEVKTVAPDKSPVTADIDEQNIAAAGKAEKKSANKSPADLKSPVARHYADKVTQSSVAKDENTLIDRAVVDVAADVAEIRANRAQQVGDTYIVNGRTYGTHDGVLYPKSGPGLYPMDRGGYKAYAVLNKFGDTPRAGEIMKNMGITPEAKAAALQAYKEINK